jgi:hypothetical protein
MKRRGGTSLVNMASWGTVPGQREGNVTTSAAMSLNGVLHRHATLGPYNTAHLLHFLNTLHDYLLLVLTVCCFTCIESCWNIKQKCLLSFSFLVWVHSNIIQYNNKTLFFTLK